MILTSFYVNFPLSMLWGQSEPFNFLRLPDLRPYMTLSRCYTLQKYLTFAETPAASDECSRSLFWTVQPLIDAFDEQRKIDFKKFCSCQDNIKHNTFVFRLIDDLLKNKRGVGIEGPVLARPSQTSEVCPGPSHSQLCLLNTEYSTLRRAENKVK